MNSAKFKSEVTISGGMVGEASAASRLRTSWCCRFSSSSDQHDTKPAANSSRAILGCTSAREWHALNAGEGDSLSSSTLKCLIHSAQSSLVTRCELSQARFRAIAFTPYLVTMPGSVAGTGAVVCSAIRLSTSDAQALVLSQSSASLMQGGLTPYEAWARRSNHSCFMWCRITALRMIGTNRAKSVPMSTAHTQIVSRASRLSSSCGPSSTFMSGWSTALAYPPSSMRGKSLRIDLIASLRVSTGVADCAGLMRRVRACSTRCTCSVTAEPRASSAPRARPRLL
mmetsp:Transcript_6449/g.17229  ORF Transcript_6449/g.17229 Transcript_6449/m.17229 type:complete len:284 (-) Transcript_6449:1604-2455(-)